MAGLLAVSTFILQIKKACDNEKLREILVSDDVFDILAEVGYTGVPHRETLDSVAKIVQ
jgi:hypothetical protein